MKLNMFFICLLSLLIIPLTVSAGSLPNSWTSKKIEQTLDLGDSATDDVTNVDPVLPTITDLLQPGDLDPTFGTDGMVLYDDPITISNEEGRAIAIQPDGKIVVTGYIFTGIRDAVLVLRYNSDGSLDNTFGTDGVVTYSECEACAGQGYAVAIQPDGKILIVGYSDNRASGYENVLILRYNIDGTPDNTFGINGVVTTDVEIDDHGYAVAMQPDGRIVVTGKASHQTDIYAMVLRYNSDGTLDNTFGTNGVSTYNGIGWDIAHGVAMQLDGKIVVPGSTSEEYPQTAYTDVLILRYNSDGTLDNTFGTNGVVTYDSAKESGQSVFIQSDAKIVVGGWISDYSGNFGWISDFSGNCGDVLILRYNSDGTLDNTFGMNGVVTYNGVGCDSMLQPDGKIIVVGSLGDDLLVLRYENNGTLDISFSGDGVGTYSTGGFARGYRLALQPDGKILITGNSTFHDNYSDHAVLTMRLIGTPTWGKAYNYIFSDPGELQILRQFRDEFLNKTSQGELYTAALYKDSEKALAVLLENPELIAKARDLMYANKDAVWDVTHGYKGVIYNTEEIAAFLDAYAKKAPPKLKLLAKMVKRQMLKKQRKGKLFFGFKLK